MEELISKITNQLSTWPQWHRSRRIVLAISGGVDSMVLLHLMFRINNQLPLSERKEFIIAHFDHQLRKESKEDAQLIREYLKDYTGIYFYGKWQEPADTNVEASARDARYRFFADSIEASEADTLMTAHHLNDLGETVLMRLMRGTSLKGISGIRATTRRHIQTSRKRLISVALLRPLVHILKEQLYAYAEAYEVPYLEDHTNFDSMYLRNRIRQNLIPMFEEENPRFLHNLIALTQQFEASYDAHYEQYLKIEPEFLMQLSNKRWLLDVPRMREFSSDILQMYILILFEERLVYEIPNYNKVALKQIEQMILQRDAPNMSIDIANNWRATRVYDFIRIEQISQAKPDKPSHAPIHVTRINQWYKLSGDEMLGVFDLSYASSMMRKSVTFEYPLTLAEDELLDLTVRHRQPGDLLTLQRKDGTVYHKKVSRVMIDMKVAKELRERYWIVEKDENILCMLPKKSRDNYFVDTNKEPTHVIYYQNKVYL